MTEWNPFAKKADGNVNAEVGDTKPGATAEKSPAELIAESVSAALSPLLEANKATNARLDTIEQATRKPVAKVEPTEIPSVFDDETAAFNNRMGPLAQRQLETEARLTLAEVKQEYIGKGYGEAWTQFESEIKAVLDNSPLVDNRGQLQRGDANYIRNAVDMVFGRAALKAGIKFGGRDKGFFIESAGAQGAPGATSAQDDGLTEAQRKVFNRMGVPTSDAKKTLSKLKFIS